MALITFPYPGATAGGTPVQPTDHTLVSPSAPTFVGMDGYMGIAFGLAAGQNWVGQDVNGTTGVDTISYADVVKIPVGADGALEIFYLRNATGQIFNLLTNTTDLFQARVASTTVLGTSTVFTEGVSYKRQIAAKQSTGQVMVRITPLAGGTALLDYSGTGANLGASAITRVQWGDLTTASTITMHVGRVAIATDADALDGTGNLKLIEPYTAVVAPPTVIEAGTVYSFPYVGAVDGADVTIANSGHTSVSTQAPNFVKRDGYTLIHFEAGAAQEWVSTNIASSDVVSYADVVYIDVAASAALEVWYLRDATTKQLNLLTNTTRLLQMRNDADANITGAVTTALTTSVGYIRQIAARKGTSTADGQVRYRVTPLAGGAPLVDFTSNVENTGTTQFAALQWGDLVSAATITMDVGRVAIATGQQALDSPNGNLKFIDPYTVTNTPSIYLATSATTSIPVQMYFATSSTTSVRVDLQN